MTYLSKLISIRICGMEWDPISKIIEFEFEQNKNMDIYWDDIPLFCYLKGFDFGIRPIYKADLIEIDSYEEPVRVDDAYCQERCIKRMCRYINEECPKLLNCVYYNNRGMFEIPK